MVPVKPYPIWPWICTTLAFGALAFSFSAKLEIERRYLQFTHVVEKGLTTWGQENGINPEIHSAKLESAYDSVLGEIMMFAVLTVIAVGIAIVRHVLHNRALRKRGII